LFEKVANDAFNQAELAVAAMGPIADLPDYQQMKQWLSLFRN
jgi:hypothetical protein